MPMVPERLLALMTPDERDQYDALMEGWKYQPMVVCPECQTPLAIRMKLNIGQVVRAHPEPGSKIVGGAPPISKPVSVPTNASGGNPREVRLLADAKSLGMFAAFEKAIREEKAGQVPDDMERAFLLFFRIAAVVRIPYATLELFKLEYPQKQIAFFQANGVVAVLADGVIVEFVPYRYCRQPKMPFGALPQTFRRSEDQLDQWVRGKFGYVPRGSKVFGEMLRQPSVGAFGRVVQ